MSNTFIGFSLVERDGTDLDKQARVKYRVGRIVRLARAHVVSVIDAGTVNDGTPTAFVTCSDGNTHQVFATEDTVLELVEGTEPPKAPREPRPRRELDPDPGEDASVIVHLDQNHDAERIPAHDADNAQLFIYLSSMLGYNLQANPSRKRMLEMIDADRADCGYIWVVTAR